MAPASSSPAEMAQAIETPWVWPGDGCTGPDCLHDFSLKASQQESHALLYKARTAWLTAKEVATLLTTNFLVSLLHAEHTPDRAQAGDLFVYDRRRVQSVRADGITWRAGKGRATLESHEKLQVHSNSSSAQPQFIKVYYAESADRSVVRRIYTPMVATPARTSISASSSRRSKANSKADHEADGAAHAQDHSCGDGSNTGAIPLEFLVLAHYLSAEQAAACKRRRGDMGAAGSRARTFPATRMAPPMPPPRTLTPPPSGASAASQQAASEGVARSDAAAAAGVTTPVTAAAAAGQLPMSRLLPPQAAQRMMALSLEPSVPFSHVGMGAPEPTHWPLHRPASHHTPLCLTGLTCDVEGQTVSQVVMRPQSPFCTPIQSSPQMSAQTWLGRSCDGSVLPTRPSPLLMNQLQTQAPLRPAAQPLPQLLSLPLPLLGDSNTSETSCDTDTYTGVQLRSPALASDTSSVSTLGVLGAASRCVAAAHSMGPPPRGSSSGTICMGLPPPPRSSNTGTELQLQWRASSATARTVAPAPWAQPLGHEQSGLAAWVDEEMLADALGLDLDCDPVLSQLAAPPDLACPSYPSAPLPAPSTLLSSRAQTCPALSVPLPLTVPSSLVGTKRCLEAMPGGAGRGADNGGPFRRVQRRHCSRCSAGTAPDTAAAALPCQCAGWSMSLSVAALSCAQL